MESTSEFRLSITRALGDQLSDALAKLSPAALTVEHISNVTARGGVYQLYLRGDLVYIGKADRNLRDRIGIHRRKVSGRENISVDDMSFIAVYVDEDLSAVAPETLLINRHRGLGELPWNFNGFGNKDPGRERDTSAVQENHFDTLYPANLELICEGLDPGEHSVADVLLSLKAELPYTFRFQGGGKATSKMLVDYSQATVGIPASPVTANVIFELIGKAMPAGWQITALPGYVIMYKESKHYPSARRLY